MNPLAAHLLAVMKREESCETRKFIDCQLALEELDYWTLVRPATHTRKQMPPCAIARECKLVDEFPSYTPPGHGIEGFDTIIEVYADKEAQ